MKYCFRYQKFNSDLMKKADEILINYRPEDTTFIDFLNLYNDKRIIVSIDKKENCSDLELAKLNAIYQKNNNFVVRLGGQDDEIVKKIKEYNMPFFFQTLVNNWDTFRGLVDLGVSDIYVVDSLGFELDKCSTIAKDKNIKIRVFPNIVQSQWADGKSIKKFFIRPDDIDIYNDYVDTFEFICDVNKEEALYNIYKDKCWYGQLKEIITGLNSEIDNRTLLPIFGIQRCSCGKRCASTGKCNICEEIELLSSSMREKNLILGKEKGE